MSASHSSAWAAFWSSNNGGKGKGGCLPGGVALENAQAQVWRAFASRIPCAASVLDLATGDGRVMGWLLDANRELQLQGVDLAPSLPSPPAGTRSSGGIAMEALPFDNESFEAVVSQFGFEYGDTTAVAAEIRRVLAPRGIVGLLTHRHDGPVLAQNLARKAQIGWAIDECRLPEVARSILSSPTGDRSRLAAVIANAPQAGARKYGRSSAAWEIAEAIRRSLAMGNAQYPDPIRQSVDMIEQMARSEMARIDALGAACERIRDEAALIEVLAQAGLTQLAVAEVRIAPDHPAFANFRTLRPVE